MPMVTFLSSIIFHIRCSSTSIILSTKKKEIDLVYQITYLSYEELLDRK